MLSVKNLTKKFKHSVAVDNLSFDVIPGKIFGLLGPNGAGKTTTIRTVLNIIKPTSGTIIFNGRPITNQFFNQIGYLPEERGLYRRSKVIDVLKYFAELKNLSSVEAVKTADEWLEKLNITHYRNKRIEELSKGNQQKIQFITAVFHDPDLLILDEPFTGFDPINQQEIKELILSFVSSGKIIILSTHQMETAEKLCNEILLINNGLEVTSGDLADIKRQFGGNNIKLQFSGNSEFLKSFHGVIHYESYSNYAEVQLSDDISPSEFLHRIIDKIEIKHFSVIEPTLNKIFIDLIKEQPI
ncbi:MAG: ABC transporter ATP-binding protein [Ignavibacteriae bacterium]|nr:MAG: ABC transporter ATP-binding protein [Ignavibacteriota bacterium]